MDDFLMILAFPGKTKNFNSIWKYLLELIKAFPSRGFLHERNWYLWLDTWSRSDSVSHNELLYFLARSQKYNIFPGNKRAILMQIPQNVAVAKIWHTRKLNYTLKCL